MLHLFTFIILGFILWLNRDRTTSSTIMGYAAFLLAGASSLVGKVADALNGNRPGPPPSKS